MLKCGVHECPSSCHQLFDHSKITCKAVLKRTCSNNHTETWRCFSPLSSECGRCRRERKETAKRESQRLEEQQRKNAAILKHQIEVSKIDEEIARITQKKRDAQLDAEQRAVLAQKWKDLEHARKAISDNNASLARTELSTHSSEHVSDQSNSRGGINPSSFTSPQANLASTEKMASIQKLGNHLHEVINHNASPSKTEWQRQKDQEGAKNPSIDSIMEMIGLESVKSQVLAIKSKVDVATRQGTDLRKERLGLMLLGNPGTGTIQE